ncbi:MAG: SDR family NAD(P)-dependent oxidoreductase [Bryobacteraceae bacterium]|jgi:3-oxoacyl-[acyl-carrier protein] reductase
MLHDRVALVTGAATGIGEATARLFAEHGAQVFLLDIDAARNEAVAASIRAQSGRADAFAVDVTDGPALAAVARAAIDRHGRIDALVNNAGIYPRRLFVDMTEAEWDHMHDVNLKSMFHAIKAVIPHMIERRSGKIVNISSVTFHQGTAKLSHYVASKGGVIGLTRSLAREFGEHNVHINCITPGAIKTESEPRFLSDDEARGFIESQSLKRRLGPLDVARVALFLATEWSDGLTGQSLNVDAGWYMH